MQIWQVPRTCAEPWRFVIVFERQMDARTAVVNLNGSGKEQSFRSSPIRLATYKTIYLEDYFWYSKQAQKRSRAFESQGPHIPPLSLDAPTENSFLKIFFSRVRILQL